MGIPHVIHEREVAGITLDLRNRTFSLSRTTNNGNVILRRRYSANSPAGLMIRALLGLMIRFVNSNPTLGRRL